MDRRALIVLTGVWLVLGLGAKAMRYAPEREAIAPRAERIVKSFLAERGWLLSDRVALTRAGVYVAQVFIRDGCRDLMAVVALGAADESADVVRQALGPDMAFLQGGQIVDHPSASASLANTLHGGLRLATGDVTPVLAIAPAPGKAREVCKPPPAGDWAALGGPAPER